MGKHRLFTWYYTFGGDKLMSSVNKVMIVGRLGKDPDLRYTNNQTAVCNLSVATNRYDKTTDWHRCVAFKGVAESAASHLKKGSLVCVEGELQYSKFMAQDGTERYVTQIVANRLSFLGGKPDAPQEPRPKQQQSNQMPAMEPVGDWDGDIYGNLAPEDL